MWYHGDPDQRLMLARARQRELIEEAQAERQARRPRTAPAYSERVRGLNLRIGRVLIVIGRTIYEDERPCPDMAS